MRVKDLEPGKIYSVGGHGAGMFEKLVIPQRSGMATKARFTTVDGRLLGTFGGQQVRGPIAETWDEYTAKEREATINRARAREERTAEGQRAADLAAQLRQLLDVDAIESLGGVRLRLTNTEAEALINTLSWAHPAREANVMPEVHKAMPLSSAVGPDDGSTWSTCVHCGLEVQKVPGGQGPTWIHSLTGAVAGTKNPNTDTDNALAPDRVNP